MAGLDIRAEDQWEDWITDRHLWVFLERRVPGKFGRLEAMHAIVPKGRKKSELATIFGSARYRRGMLDRARELFRRAGVPEDQAAVRRLSTDAL